MKSDGIKNPDLKVKRVSQISSEYGFDIVSLRGNKLSFDKVAQEEIEIEVKSSVLENEELFTFYVTKNEWIKSQMYGESYFFYCWSGVSDKMNDSRVLLLFQGQKLKPFIPKDENESCEWMISRFILNLKLISL